MPFKWDAQSERNLLLSAIKVMGNPPATIWDQVAETIGNGHEVNGNACSQKFYKLKKESENLLAEGGGVASSNDAATPTKAPKTPGSKGTGGRKRKNADIDGDGEVATPSKRGKAKKGAAPEVEVKTEVENEVTPAVKVESADGNAK
ncbi:hypothetical protein G647_03509 [Cladophialophora carrionii CBS 160.54]|uniref:Myb-like domain-containing protein n=1 Tax=Cladophialophora carrionii CBS 160.54 TaxID=1279043 RepID=V9DBC0_9EURO|nr:uncharacterized protein G647_03509 [Cladophialophora carrionii CBS 160.54]ETI24140.1 hypothetical protein G647_03509 [Cladophialophora carrionii CBS 160.54]